jgi:signal transduction histidine kinase
MRRYLAGVVVAAAFVVAGLAAGWLAQRGTLTNVLFTGEFSVDLAGLSARLGLALGAISLGGVTILWRVDRHISRVKSQEQHIHNEARQRFLQRLDHELKNPLTIIRQCTYHNQASSFALFTQGHAVNGFGERIPRIRPHA